MAYDIGRAKPMFDQDRERFRKFLTAQATARGLSAAIDHPRRRLDRGARRRHDGQDDRAAVARSCSRRSPRPSRRSRSFPKAITSPPPSSCTATTTCISTSRALLDPRVVAAIARDPGERRRICQSRSAPPRHSDRLRADVRGHRAHRAAVVGLDRARFRQSAGGADPPADRRGQCRLDRQSACPGAGAPLGRRPRPARRDLQQDDAGAAHAARRHRARARSDRQPAAIHRSGAGRRQRRRHRRQCRRPHHHPQPLGGTADRAHRKRGARSAAWSKSRPSSPKSSTRRATAASGWCSAR